MTFNKKRAAIIGTVAAVALSGTGVAYAYWTSTGNGAGSATAGTSVAWSFNSQATSGGALSPDGPTQTATFNVRNDGTGVQKLTSVVVSIKNSNGTAWTSGTCSAADFSLNGGAAGVPASVLAAPVDMAPGDDAPQSVTIQMVDTGANQNDCKNVTVPLFYAAS